MSRILTLHGAKSGGFDTTLEPMEFMRIVNKCLGREVVTPKSVRNFETRIGFYLEVEDGAAAERCRLAFESNPRVARVEVESRTVRDAGADLDPVADADIIASRKRRGAWPPRNSTVHTIYVTAKNRYVRSRR